LIERVADLMESRRHREPNEQRERSADDEKMEEDRDGLGNAMPAEPLDAGPDRGRQGHGEEQEDDHAAHLPDSEGERGNGKRGGGRLRHAHGEVVVAVRVRVHGGLRRLSR
jgi:hypothetical protein